MQAANVSYFLLPFQPTYAASDDEDTNFFKCSSAERTYGVG